MNTFQKGGMLGIEQIEEMLTTIGVVEEEREKKLMNIE